MSRDVQILSYEGSATLRSVNYRSSPVPSLDVRGENFVDVVSVYVNGHAAREFIVLSSTRLLVEIPYALIDAAIESVSVRTAQTEITATTIIHLDVGVGARVAEGLVRLVQTFLKLLLTTPGTDIFRPDLGGGLRQLTGRTDNAQGTNLKASATRSVEVTKTQMIALQALNPAIDDSEKLKTAVLTSTSFEGTTLGLRIKLTAMSGDSAEAGVAV